MKVYVVQGIVDMQNRGEKREGGGALHILGNKSVITFDNTNVEIVQALMSDMSEGWD